MLKNFWQDHTLGDPDRYEGQVDLHEIEIFTQR